MSYIVVSYRQSGILRVPSRIQGLSYVLTDKEVICQRLTHALANEPVPENETGQVRYYSI